MKTLSTLVRGLLAYQIGWSPSSIAAGHRLQQDLRLTPLGLVIVALEVEELAGIRVPAQKLATVETVDELVGFFSMAVERKRRSERKLRAA